MATVSLSRSSLLSEPEALPLDLVQIVKHLSSAVDNLQKENKEMNRKITSMKEEHNHSISKLQVEVASLRCALEETQAAQKADEAKLRAYIESLEKRLVPIEVGVLPMGPADFDRLMNDEVTTPPSTQELALALGHGHGGCARGGENETLRVPNWASFDFMDNDCGGNTNSNSNSFFTPSFPQDEGALSNRPRANSQGSSSSSASSSSLSGPHSPLAPLSFSSSSVSVSVAQPPLRTSNDRCASRGDVDLSERMLVSLAISILSDYGSVPVGKMGSLLHKAANNHSLPALLKDRYGGLKKFLQSHPEEFILGSDHPYNPHVYLKSSVSQTAKTHPSSGAESSTLLPQVGSSSCGHPTNRKHPKPHREHRDSFDLLRISSDVFPPSSGSFHSFSQAPSLSQQSHHLMSAHSGAEPVSRVNLCTYTPLFFPEQREQTQGQGQARLQGGALSP